MTSSSQVPKSSETTVDLIFRRLNGGSFGVTLKDQIRAVLHACPPPEVTDEMVELAAIAICGNGDERYWQALTPREQAHYRTKAKRALSAAFSTTRAEGDEDA